MLFILSIRKTIRTGQKEINHTAFYRAFHSASFGKKFKVLLFTEAKIFAKSKMLEHHGHPVL
jgi:hypothetical protein